MKLEIKPIPIEQEPKRENRFYVEFPSQFKIPSYTVQTCMRPKLVDYVCQDCIITFLDIINPSTSDGVKNMIDYCQEHENEETLFKFQIKQLDPIGTTINTWTISVKELVEVDFGACNYDNSDISMIKVVLKPSYCMLS